MKHITTLGIVLLTSALMAVPLHADLETFDSVNVASAISWAPGYSVATREGNLRVGAQGTNRGRSLFRFDVSSLAGTYASIESVTLSITNLVEIGGGGPGTVELFRVDDIQTGWTDRATMAEMDGDGSVPDGDAGSVPWVGGVDILSTHTGSALASTTVARNDPVGNVYEWTVTGAAAETLIDDWTTGVNSGLSLNHTSETGTDYRAIIVGANGVGGLAPQLSVELTPIPEPSSLLLLLLGGIGLFSLRPRRAKR